MRHFDVDETSGERAREADQASETRRWSLGRDAKEPLSAWIHVLIGIVLVALLLWLAHRLHVG